MSEVAERPKIEKITPPLVIGNEYVDGYLSRQESFLDITDDDIAFMIGDMERVVGREFRGDLNTAIYLSQQFIDGMSAPVTEQLTDEQIKFVKFGLIWKLPSTAALYPFLKRAGADEYHRAGALDYETLERSSLKDPSKIIKLRRRGNDDYYHGPRWYYFRALGLEEGAHAAHVAINGVPQFPDNPQNLSVAEYHASDVEFDGLEWRIWDEEKILRDLRLSPKDRYGITQARELNRIQLRQARSIRMNRLANKDPNFFKKHPFGV